MKLHTSTYKAEGSGFDKVAGYRMVMNAKTARALSDTLYKDKHGAIIRELSCNAFDAHIDAGKPDVPFTITLPDAFNPQLVIRDYGYGIPHEDIEEIYCVYFGSTKDQSNDSVGAFGLGSKTPFAYTDSFMVTSIHKGVKRIYNAYMDEGIPAISQFGDGEETDEPDGLEVTVTVERKDFQSFSAAVRRQLRFFPVKPEIKGDTIQWPEIKDNIIDVDGFTYFSNTDALLSGFFVKQGPVAYPVDFDVVFDHYKSTLHRPVPELLNFLNKLGEASYYSGRSNRNKGAVLDMPIGTVEVVPSREGISYNTATLDNIIAAIDNVVTKLFGTIEDKMVAEYNTGYRQFINYCDSLEPFMRDTLTKEYVEKNFKPFTVDGNKHIRIALPKKFAGITLSRYGASWKNPKPVKYSEYDTAQWKDETDHNGNPRKYADSNVRTSSLKFALDGDHEMFIKDEKYAFVQRANDASDGKFVVADAGSLSQDKLLEFGKWMEKLALVGVTLISDTQRPARNTGGGGHSTTGGEKRSWFYVSTSDISSNHYGMCYGGRTLYRMNCREEYDLNIKDYDGKRLVYMTTHNNKLNDLDQELIHMLELVAGYMALVDETGLVAIPNSDALKAEKSDNFISLDEYYRINKDAILDRVKVDINNQLLNSYRERLDSNIKAVNSIVSFDGMNGVDDVELIDDIDNNYTIIGKMAKSRFCRAVEEVGRRDLYDYYQKAIADGIEAANSIDEAEKLLLSNGVSFNKFTDTVSQLRKMLLRKDNAKPALQGFHGIGDHMVRELTMLDPWKVYNYYNKDNRIMFNSKEMVSEIIQNLP